MATKAKASFSDVFCNFAKISSMICGVVGLVLYFWLQMGDIGLLLIGIGHPGFMYLAGYFLEKNLKFFSNVFLAIYMIVGVIFLVCAVIDIFNDVLGLNAFISVEFIFTLVFLTKWPLKPYVIIRALIPIACYVLSFFSWGTTVIVIVVILGFIGGFIALISNGKSSSGSSGSKGSSHKSVSYLDDSQVNDANAALRNLYDYNLPAGYYVDEACIAYDNSQYCYIRVGGDTSSYMEQRDAKQVALSANKAMRSAGVRVSGYLFVVENKEGRSFSFNLN